MREGLVPRLGTTTRRSIVAPQIGVQELLIVPEGHASIRLAVRAQHVGMRKYTSSTEHLVVVDRIKANGPNAVERLRSQCKVIDIRRCRTAHPDVDIARVVQLVA